MQAMVLVAASQGGWASLPDDLMQHFLERVVRQKKAGEP